MATLGFASVALTEDAHMAEPFGAAPSQADLDDLLAAVANGDAGAFADLYAQISPAAFGLAIRVIGDRHLAEEVLQEVFLHIWRNASTFDADRGAAKGWILMLTHRRSVDRVRAVQCARERDIADAARIAATPGGDTATEAELRIDGARLRQQLSGLSAAQRRVIELSYFGGHTHAEIAELIGCPLGTVKSRIRDALPRLRRHHSVPAEPVVA